MWCECTCACVCVWVCVGARGCADDQSGLAGGVGRAQVRGAEGGDVHGGQGGHSLQRDRYVGHLVAGVGEHHAQLRAGAAGTDR